MNRLHDWQLHLEAFARDRVARPFAWGSNDCALFAADAVLAMTGEDPARGMRGYSGVRQALRVLHAAGGVQGVATTALGAPISPRMAAVGDVVIVRTGKREALAICNGQTAIAAGLAGMVAVPMADAVLAWRVG